MISTGDRIEVMTKSGQVHDGRLTSLSDEEIVFKNRFGDEVHIRWDNVEYYKQVNQQIG